MLTRLAATPALAFAMLAVAFPAHASGQVTLEAAAGVGEVAKPGRWMPVRATVAFTGDELAGELTVEWGDVVVRRALSFASGGTRTFELYVRTSEPSPLVRVRVRRDDMEIARRDIAVRVLRPDEPVEVCVSSGPAAARDRDSCTASSTVEALPWSPRAYEAVDSLAWADQSGSPAPRTPSSAARLMTVPQRTALAQWQSLRRLDASGDLSLAPQPARPTLPRGLPGSTAATVLAGAAVYLGCVLVAGLRFAARGPHTSRAYVAVGLAVTAATAAATLIGRLGPGRAIEIHHSSLLQQVPDGEGSLLTVRGVAVFPAFGRYAISIPVSDATLEASTASGRASQGLDANGHPLLAGTFGLGARQGFVVEGVTSLQPLAVAFDGQTVRVTNRSAETLTGCRFGDGFEPGTETRIEPGAAISARWVARGLGPMLTCTMPALPIPFDAGDRDVSQAGATAVAVYMPAAGAHPEAPTHD